MELQVLEGGRGLIERTRPVVLFEVNLSQLRSHSSSPRVLEQFFIRRGYRLYFPLAQKDGVLARVRSATLLTLFIAPRAWLFFGDSAPFDLLAVPKERPIPLRHVGFMSAIKNAIGHNSAVKYKRIISFFRSIF